MRAPTKELVNDVLTHLNFIATQSNENIGSRYFINSFARKHSITFELARNCLYRACDAQTVIITPTYTIIPAKEVENNLQYNLSQETQDDNIESIIPLHNVTEKMDIEKIIKNPGENIDNLILTIVKNKINTISDNDILDKMQEIITKLENNDNETPEIQKWLSSTENIIQANHYRDQFLNFLRARRTNIREARIIFMEIVDYL